MFTRSNFELKVGIFIFIGIVILSVIVFSIGNFYSIKKGYTMSVVFNFANGINVGAPVRYSGVEVGEVRNIEVYFDEKENSPMVKVGIWASENTWITEDSAATINTLGLLGEKYLEITSGSREAARLKQGGVLRGRDPVSTEELTRETKKTLTNVDAMLQSINDIVGDEELKNSLKEMVSNLKDLSGDLKEFTSFIKEGKGTIGRLVKDDTLYKDMDDLVLEIKNNPWKLLYRPRERKH
jgi:phospholipid/cholesterol/gamma-HCH transport system substrate-binding protein